MRTAGTYNPAEATELDGDNPLKVSKSSFVCVNKCPRQYWWRHIGLADVDIPPSPEMLRGSRIHSAYEHLCANDFKSRFPEPPFTNDILNHLWKGLDDDVAEDEHEALKALASLENYRIEDWGRSGAVPLMFEEKLHYDCPELGVRLVGMPDAVFLRPNGDLFIVELKTGNWNDGKMGRTRKELAFYWHILNKLGYGEKVTGDVYFMYIAPDCMNYELLQKLESMPSKQVWSGDEQGITIIEKMNNRSYTTMQKHLIRAVEKLKTQEWDMKWDDYYCSQWCDFYMSCDNELNGDAEPPWEQQPEQVDDGVGWDS